MSFRELPTEQVEAGRLAVIAALTIYVAHEHARAAGNNAAMQLAWDDEFRPELVIAGSLGAVDANLRAAGLAPLVLTGATRARAIQRASNAWRRAIGEPVRRCA